ncbi:hypothetical protein MKK68_29235 [Methylobacterium sp. E-016]|nr:hypothetical protein [Methylobacterium sp. E-016]MCJ2079663.1 hypothetical protein [Methylobacterium sp. E-016]
MDYDNRESLRDGDPGAHGRRSWMPLYLTTLLVAVVALERLIDHLLA